MCKNIRQGLVVHALDKGNMLILWKLFSYCKVYFILSVLLVLYQWTIMNFNNQMDVKIAFVNGHMEEEIYMLQTESFGEIENILCKLDRSIYHRERVCSLVVAAPGASPNLPGSIPISDLGVSPGDLSPKIILQVLNHQVDRLHQKQNKKRENHKWT